MSGGVVSGPILGTSNWDRRKGERKLSIIVDCDSEHEDPSSERMVDGGVKIMNNGHGGRKSSLCIAAAMGRHQEEKAAYQQITDPLDYSKTKKGNQVICSFPGDYG